MTADDLEFHLSGADASRRASELEKRLVEAFGAENASLERREAPHRPDERLEGHEIATIVLALPGAILATMQIAERLRLSERLKPIIEDIKKTYEGISPPECHIKPPGESLKTPSDTSAAAILDAAQKSAKKPE